MCFFWRGMKATIVHHWFVYEWLYAYVSLVPWAAAHSICVFGVIFDLLLYVCVCVFMCVCLLLSAWYVGLSSGVRAVSVLIKVYWCQNISAVLATPPSVHTPAYQNKELPLLPKLFVSTLHKKQTNSFCYFPMQSLMRKSPFLMYWKEVVGSCRKPFFFSFSIACHCLI